MVVLALQRLGQLVGLGHELGGHPLVLGISLGELALGDFGEAGCGDAHQRRGNGQAQGCGMAEALELGHGRFRGGTGSSAEAASDEP